MSVWSPQYWRESKTWRSWIGREGVVITATQIHVAAPEFADITPYSLALVDFGEEKKLFPVVGQQTVEIGQKVRCVLRRMGTPEKSGVIPYGIKVEPLL